MGAWDLQFSDNRVDTFQEPFAYAEVDIGQITTSDTQLFGRLQYVHFTNCNPWSITTNTVQAIQGPAFFGCFVDWAYIRVTNNWAASTDNQYRVWTVAHELGHALMLHHYPNGFDTLMNSSTAVAVTPRITGRT